MATEKRLNCPMRHDNGNCLPCGGFCTAVNDSICESLHNAFRHGQTAEYERLTLEVIKENRKFEEERLEALRKLYEKVTTIASERPHGQMEEIEPCNIMVDRQCCSCGTAMGSQDNYCPNCGADMRERKDKDI